MKARGASSTAIHLFIHQYSLSGDHCPSGRELAEGVLIMKKHRGSMRLKMRLGFDQARSIQEATHLY